MGGPNHAIDDVTLVFLHSTDNSPNTRIGTRKEETTASLDTVETRVSAVNLDTSRQVVGSATTDDQGRSDELQVLGFELE